MLLGFGTSVLLARLLGGVGYGRYAYSVAWAAFLTTPAILGFDRFLVRGIAVYAAQSEWRLAKGLLVRTHEVVAVLGLAIAALACAFAIAFIHGALRWTFCVSMVLVPITALTLLRQGAMQAIGRVVSGQLPEYIIRPVIILAGLAVVDLVARRALTSTTAIAMNVAGVGIAWASGTLVLHRSLPVAVKTATAQYETRMWLRASLPMMLVSSIWLLNGYVTILVVGSISGAKAAGVYNVVQTGALVVSLGLAAANMPLAPAIARMHARNDRAGLQHTAERVAQATLAVSAPIAIAFAVFPGVFLGIFGADFQTGSTALAILALAQLVNAAAGPAGNVLLMTGYERDAVRGVGMGLCVNIALALLLVPSLGVTGGAIAAGSSIVTWNTVLTVMARRRTGVNVTAFRFLSINVRIGSEK